MQLFVRNESIDKLQTYLGEMPSACQSALARAVNRALTTYRKTTSQEIRSDYSISNADSYANINIRNATKADITGKVTFAGNMLPISMFRYTVNIPGRRLAYGAVLRSSSMTPFQHIFAANMGGGTKLYERVGADRFPVRAIKSPGMPIMAGQERVTAPAAEAAEITLDKRIDAEISAVLNGYVK